MFYDSAARQTKLRIRCDYDGLTQSQFFRMMVTGYIEKDELIYNYVKKYKQEYGVHGQNKSEKIDRMHKKSKTTMKKFKLEEQEVEDIFDIIEMETNL